MINDGQLVCVSWPVKDAEQTNMKQEATNCELERRARSEFGLKTDGDGWGRTGRALAHQRPDERDQTFGRRQIQVD